jgi:hypothetical protein
MYLTGFWQVQSLKNILSIDFAIRKIELNEYSQYLSIFFTVI